MIRYSTPNISNVDIKRTIKEFYSAFFTKKELNKVLEGKEYWFDADECMERYEKLQAKREKLAKKADLLALHNQRTVLESHIEMVDALIEDASK